MKKVFALLASLAVSASMFAFAGCDNPSEGGNLTDGNYTEKTPEEMEDIIENIDPDKVFGGDKEGEPNLNYGLKFNLSGGYSMGSEMSSTISAIADLTLASVDDGIIGAGSASYNSTSTMTFMDTVMTTSAKYDGKAYLENFVLYADAKGTSTSIAEGQTQKQEIDEKAKINLMEIAAAAGDMSPLPDEGLPQMSIVELLTTAKQYGVSVAVDDKNGVKFKLSASEDTVWAIFENVSTIPWTEEGIAEVKKAVTFNKFQFDLYFALDKDGAFNGASAVVDIDVSVDTSVFAEMMEEEGSEATVITAYVKGSVEIYKHDGKVIIIPAGLANDESYHDYTDTVLEILKDYV